MKKTGSDKEWHEDRKRKRLLTMIAAGIVIVTIIVCVSLSHLAVKNVSTKEGVQAIKSLEKTDVAEIEKQITDREAEEAAADEAWKNRPLTEKFASAVVLGDSRAYAFESYGVLEPTSVAAGDEAVLTGLDEWIEMAVGQAPQTVFISLGLNDLTATNGDSAAFKEQYVAVINTLKERLPEAKICVNSILGVREDLLAEHPEYAYISEYNEVISKLCKETGAVYVDCSDLKCEDYFEEDGEHFLSDFYTIWGERMAEVAGI